MKKEYYSYAILLVLFTILYSINSYMPLMADDYRYAQNWQQTHHLQAINEIWQFQVKHYLEWGGRSLAHTLAQLMLFWGKPVYNVLDSLVFVSLILLLYYHIKGEISRKIEPMLLLAIIFLTWFCIPTFGETVVWLVGSCNYLWMTTLVLAFLLPYRLYLAGKFDEAGCLKAPAMLLFGILAGWTNENTGLTMVLAVMLVNLYAYKKKRLHSWLLWGMAGAVIGVIILIAAPGNYMRMGEAEMGNYSFWQNHIIDPLKTMSTLALHQLPIYIVLISLCRRIKKFYQTNHGAIWQAWVVSNWNTLMCSAGYILLSFAAQLVMFASPTFPQRAGMGAVMFLIIGTLTLLKLDICQEYILYRRKRLAAGFICLLWLTSSGMALSCYQTIAVEYQQRMGAIAEAQAAGIKDMRVKAYSVKDRSIAGIVVVNDIGTDPTKFRSIYHAKYFGFDSMARSKTDTTKE